MSFPPAIQQTQQVYFQPDISVQQNQAKGSSRSLFQRIHEILNKLSLFYEDICTETGIELESFLKWINSDQNYDYQAVEAALEKWVESKQPKYAATQDDKQYYQTRSSYLRRLDISSANKWIEATATDRLPEREKGSGENLLPISIDIDLEGQTFKDNIIWNYNEPYFTPETFAKHLVKENRLNNLEQEIVNAIRRGTSNFREYEPREPELIRTIELNILIENVQLKDRFEWDINDSSNSPELFALNMCAELGLSGEFAQRIAYQIHEQILSYQKQIIERRTNITAQSVKKSTRSLIESSSTFANFDSKYQFQSNTLITPENYLRTLSSDKEFDSYSWEPKILILAPEDIRKVQKEEQRKQRLIRRSR